MAELQRLIGDQAQTARRAVVGETIAHGPIPANVTGVRNRYGNPLVLNSLGHWHKPGSEDPETCYTEGPCSAKPLEYLPLIVTAVREPEHAAEPSPCPDRTPHEPHPHRGFAGPEGVPPSQCPGVPAEPKPVDVMTAVREYGDEMVHYGETGEHRHAEAASLQLDRIEAEVQRLRANGDARQFLDTVNMVNAQLFDARRERDEALAEVDRVGKQAAGWMEQAQHQAAKRDELFAEVERLKAAQRSTLSAEEVERLNQMIEDARAEVERLKAEVRSETEISDEYADWASKLAHAAVERLDVPITEEAHTELWEAALDALRAPAAAPDPLVLFLPTVPEGAVALVGIKGSGEPGKRYVPDLGGTWREETGALGRQLGALLDVEQRLRVEFAPPREPRRWELIAAAPEDVRRVEVKRLDGMQFVAVRRSDDRWALVMSGSNPEALELSETYSWSELLGEGDVTEVFDEAGDR